MDFKQWCETHTDISSLSKKMKSSIPEQYIGFYLSKVFTNDIEYQKQFDWLGNYSLDIYIPSLNLAIEYDGEYWHKDKESSDQFKSKLCRKFNITLIRIVEVDPDTNQADKRIRNMIVYHYHKKYTNIGIPIADLCDTLTKLYGITVSIDVDIERDLKEITAYIQQKYHRKTIAYIWPESEIYWNDDRTRYDTFCTSSKSRYSLKCPHCGKKFILYMRYDYSDRALRPCECEYKTIEAQLQEVIGEYKRTKRLPVFTETLESRRLYDRIIHHLRYPRSYNVSKTEREMYCALGFQMSLL